MHNAAAPAASSVEYSAKLAQFGAQRRVVGTSPRRGARIEGAQLPIEALDRRDGDGRPAAVVWKNSWLSPSETFVRDQVAAMRQWRPVLFGISVMADGLPMPVDCAPFPDSKAGLVLRKILARFGYPGVYDREAHKNNVRLIHAHFAGGGIAAASLARRLDVPLVVTFHGKDVTGDPLLPGAVGRRYRRNLGRLFDQSSTLIAVSEHIRRRLIELGAPEEKVIVHRIGIPLRAVKADQRRAGVLFVGRLVEKKGVSDLLNAMDRLPSALRESVPLTIIGYGPLEGELRRQADRLGLPDVRFLGRLGSEEVAVHLASSLVFCAPSKTASDGDTEGLPISLLEAALHSAAVVSTEHAGIPEFVASGESGLLSPEGDVDLLTVNLERMLSDAAFRNSAAAALRRTLFDEYDIAEQTRKLESIYDRVIGVPS
ncbi:glycosyltransferase involved in cell wall biosynthesis [Rathayibacter sp. PhB179]|nr:glycosyltransferase involved in cell wall biosynthesis [Rathayibacter sp. PhB192]TCM30138.1 glycosyltransferase involved in cell wall biosynthesis [Rathayibacter sp. PhB179]